MTTIDRPSASAADATRDVGEELSTLDPGDFPTTLATAQLCWQIGDWSRLAALDVSPDATATPESRRLIAYKFQGLLQAGDLTLAREIYDKALSHSDARMEVARLLLSGASTSLSRARMLRGQDDAAERLIRDAVALHPSLGDCDLVASLRLGYQRRALLPHAPAATRIPERPRKLFIDCGAYDGCSALLFLLSHPDFDCVSFEPNPALWGYFDEIPTTLIKAAAYTHDGDIAFTLDPVDADGSSLISGKKIDFHDSVKDENCPVILVNCINLSRFVSQKSELYDEIYLKLDVEGAEYDILEQMLENGSLRDVARLYCEFHAAKMTAPDLRHDRILREVSAVVEVEPWDAIPLSIHKKTPAAKLAAQRRLLIDAILERRKRPASS